MDPQHNPATCVLDTPTEQAYLVARLHEPSIGHGGLFFLHEISSLPPSVQRHDQVDVHPHEPATFAEDTPVLQVN